MFALLSGDRKFRNMSMPQTFEDTSIKRACVVCGGSTVKIRDYLSGCLGLMLKAVTVGLLSLNGKEIHGAVMYKSLQSHLFPLYLVRCSELLRHVRAQI